MFCQRSADSKVTMFTQLFFYLAILLIYNKAFLIQFKALKKYFYNKYSQKIIQWKLIDFIWLNFWVKIRLNGKKIERFYKPNDALIILYVAITILNSQNG